LDGPAFSGPLALIWKELLTSVGKSCRII
jgi:hypothetical protein